MPVAICTPGWEERCACATSKKCICLCGGANHGTATGNRPAAGQPEFDIFGMTGEDGKKVELQGFIVGHAGSRRVFVNGGEIHPEESQKIINHSPDGFNWGYGGSAPAQLSLAILLEFGVKPDKALQLHHDFKASFIEGLPQGRNFQLPIERVQAYLKAVNAYEK